MAKQSSSLNGSEQISKAKLAAIEKSRHFNPTNQKLLELYLETLPHVHPSEEVVKIIKDLLFKDQSSIFLWKHYLNNACNAMSCTTEIGLKEYEKVINIIRKMNDSDLQMMQLFKMSSLFLRQAGLMEQFFALVNLMVSININADVERIFYASNESQNAHLMEYEELVLQCNLPMPELFFRVETLRSICNFLPVRLSSGDSKMEDPQRYVFNEDICNLVNPLRNQRAYSFDLFLLILKLFKFPMPHYNFLHNNEIFASDEREIECGMNFLSLLLENLPPIDDNFNSIFYNVVKDVNVSPNFFNFNIEFEPYFEIMLKFLESCSCSFNECQNKIVLILWLRLQRLAVKIDMLKLKADEKSQDVNESTKYKKQIKTRVKNILKSSKFQNDLNIYREYALIELSLGDEKAGFNILKMAIDAARSSSELNLYQLVIEFCEQKIMRKENEESLEMLKSLSEENLVDFLTEKLTQVSDDTSEEIEDFFLPTNNPLELIKAKVLFLLITRSKQIALREILAQIANTKEGSQTREKLFEFFVWTFHQKIHNDEMLNHRQYMETLSKALQEFPKNIFIMHTIASQSSFRWFDVRKMLLKTPTNESIFYLLIASKNFQDKFSIDDSKIYQHRIFNTIDGLMTQNTIGVSSILTWRLYLRVAFNYDFSRCRRILYQALDKYPMVKSFYLDGSRYLSEDLSQLHDLIIEKGIRIHSLIEELEILRSTSK